MVSGALVTARNLTQSLATWFANVAGITGTTSSANVVVGDSTGYGVQDSGNQLIKTGVAAADPKFYNDSGQGYVVGSTWINTANNTIWIASSVTPGNAVWTQAIGLSPYTSLGSVFGSTVAGATAYAAIGGTGANQNIQIPISQGGTISTLYVHVAVAPDAGKSFVLTLYVGAAAAMTATSVTCTVAAGTQDCSDLTHTASITAGQFWAIQIVNGSSSVGTGTSSFSVKVLFQ
jgi:hypothetical protein